MQTVSASDYREFILARWRWLAGLQPVTPWERRLLNHARFSIWLEARRNGIKVPWETQKN